MIGTAIFGIPVSKTLLPGGWFDPGSESSQASALLSQKFGQGDMVMLITLTSSDDAEGPRARAVGTDLAARLQDSPNVGQVQSAWTVPAVAADAFISKDGKTASRRW